MIERTINSTKGLYIVLFVIAAGIAAMWSGLAMIYAVFGLTGLVITCIGLSSVIFIYCAKTYEGFDVAKFFNQRDAIANLDDTVARVEATVGKMIAHENDQDRLIHDLMLVLSMDREENWSNQLSDARKIAARMKASILAVKKI